MANRIKGITVEIGGDTTKLQTALKGVNSEIKNTQSQLKDVEKLLKLDPGNTELLTQRQKLLGDVVKETKEKLKTVGDKISNVRIAQNQDEYNARYDALVSRYEATKAERDSVAAGIRQKGIRRREFQRFISTLEKLPDTVTEFDEACGAVLWSMSQSTARMTCVSCCPAGWKSKSETTEKRRFTSSGVRRFFIPINDYDARL